MSNLFQAVSTNQTPFVWAGFDTPRLVSLRHLSQWTVPIQEEGQVTLPRAWIDVEGQPIQSVWQKMCRAVVGVLYMHSSCDEVSSNSQCYRKYTDDKSGIEQAIGSAQAYDALT